MSSSKIDDIVKEEKVKVEENQDFDYVKIKFTGVS